MPLSISSHQTQCCASVYTYGGHYDAPGMSNLKSMRISSLCLENKDTACIPKKPSYSSCKINCFVLFCFVYLPSLPPISFQSGNFIGTGEGIKVHGMNLQEASQVLPLSTAAPCPTGFRQYTNTRDPSGLRPPACVSVGV